MLKKNSSFNLFGITKFIQHIVLCCSVTQTCSLLFSTGVPADNCRIQATIKKTLWKSVSDCLCSVLLWYAGPSPLSTFSSITFWTSISSPQGYKVKSCFCVTSNSSPPVPYMKRGEKEQLIIVEKLRGIFKYFLNWT